MKRETEFLGHIVTKDGIKPNPEKVSCIQKFPLPKTPKEIKQFIGLTGYYRKFIKDYSKIAKPMTKYLKQNAKMNTNDEEYIDSFKTLKQLLTHDPILQYPDFNKQFVLQTDASNFALGAILSQNGHPICYASRTLNNHEQNYSTIKKELLAVVWATQYFRPYLFGRKFIIETDHRPLTWLFNIKEPSSKLVRWRLKISEFDYEIRFKKGVKNGNADALSRVTINLTEAEEQRIKEVQRPLNFYKRQVIIKKINSGSLKIRKTNIFRFCRTTILTKTLDRPSVKTLIQNHFKKNKTTAVYIEDETFFRTFSETVCAEFKKDYVIFRCKKLLRDIKEENELAEIIQKEHLKNNHRGISENFLELKEEIYHPKLKDRITKYINNCEVCNKEKYERKPLKPKFQLTETPNGPKEVVHVDVFYSLNKTLFLTIIDKFSKHAQAIKIIGRSWTEFKKAIIQYLSNVGHIKKIIVDNELGFKAIPLQEFLKENNIEIHFTSSGNHTSNADVERLHNTINEHIRILKHDPNKDTETTEEKIFRIIKYYNDTIHSTTGRKPIDFINGTITREDYISIKEKIEKKKQNKINKLNQKREDVNIRSGPVFLKQVRGGKNYSRFKKANVQELDENHVTLKGQKYYKAHIKQNKKFQTIQ